MILKLGMKHQAIELYKVCINHDPDLFLRQGQLRLPTHLNGENCYNVISRAKLAVKNLYDLKKKLTPEVALTLSWGYIHVYYHSSQTSLLIYISVLR